MEEKTLAKILKASSSAFIYVAGFSCLINILMLTVPIYMLQLFDRVLASQSYDTLVYLTLIAIIAVLTLGLLEMVRSHILTRVSRWIDHKLSGLALGKSIDHSLHGGNYSVQSLSDITTLRQFLGGNSVFAFFDAPWVIVYLIVIFLLDPMLGIISTIGAVILFVLAILNEIVSRVPLRDANQQHIQNSQYISGAIKNAESIQAMGMFDEVSNRWKSQNESVLQLQSSASDRSGVILSISKFIRMALQILVLGVGAYLVIQGDITAGVMIAASIIMGRALAPIEQAISSWKQAVSAHQAYKRLEVYLLQPDLRPMNIDLPDPKGLVQLENVLYIPPGIKKPILQNIGFNLQPGEQLVIVGPSGAGKSTLARLLVGLWLPTNGSVRLDGADIYSWNRHDIGRHIGYLQQGASLFQGTVKDNVARLKQDNNEQLIIEAAQMAGAHEVILRFKQGYNTNVAGYELSGGQQQRVALARAFYGNPCFVVLDEPETNLDQAGIKDLQAALKRAREKKMTMIYITQRPQIADCADKALILRDGKIAAFGKREDVLKDK